MASSFRAIHNPSSCHSVTRRFPQAYKKIPGQIKQYGELKLPLSPVKGKLVAWAVCDQIARNMMLLEAPLMSKAPDGTVVETMAGVKLTLVTK